MGACYHTAGVQCDNCRTGLTNGPWFDPTINRWTPAITVEKIYPAPVAPDDKIERLETTIEELRAEVRSLAELVKALHAEESA